MEENHVIGNKKSGIAFLALGFVLGIMFAGAVAYGLFGRGHSPESGSEGFDRVIETGQLEDRRILDGLRESAGATRKSLDELELGAGRLDSVLEKARKRAELLEDYWRRTGGLLVNNHNGDGGE